jgi:hypothetical protein
MSSANSYATIVKREPLVSYVLILAFATPQKALAKTYLSPRLIVALSRSVYGLILTLRQAICTIIVHLRTSSDRIIAGLPAARIGCHASTRCIGSPALRRSRIEPASRCACRLFRVANTPCGCLGYQSRRRTMRSRRGRRRSAFQDQWGRPSAIWTCFPISTCFQ